jgi:hypothetical protein
MCVYDDFDGVFFTIQSIRMYHPEVVDDIEFIVIDNNPTSKYGAATKNFVSKLPSCKYYEFTEYNSTTIKNKVFEYATTPYVLCIDCHIMLTPGSVRKLIEYFETEDTGNLLHGPLIWDNMVSVSTHLSNEWGSYMQGKWQTDSKYTDSNSDPFDIYAQGMGLFACRKDSWLGFNHNFRGFGGEEIYIHNKYRKYGKRVLLLPFLGWLHRFNRPRGVPYPNTYKDRYRNYLIGRIELQQDTDEIDDVFSSVISEDDQDLIKEDVVKLFTSSKCKCKS